MSAVGGTLRQAGVTLLREPLSVALSAAALAVGLATFTAALILVDALLWHPPAWREPSRVAVLGARYTDDPVRSASPDLVSAMRGVAGVTSLGAARIPEHVNVMIGTQRRLVDARQVDATFLDTLGVTPVLGSRLRGQGGVMISYAFWQTALGGRRDAIGRMLRVDASPLVIRGVLPPGYRFFSDVDLLLPMAPVSAREAHADNLTAVARLAPGARMDGVSAAVVQRANAPGGEATLFGAGPLDEALRFKARPALLAFLGAAGVVLAVAGINLSELMLARAVARSRDTTLRLMMGAPAASVWVIVLIEALTMAVVAAAAGIPLGAACVAAFADLIPDAWRTSPLPLATHGVVYALVAATDACIVMPGAIMSATLPTRTHELLRERLAGAEDHDGQRGGRHAGRAMLVMQAGLAAFLLLRATAALLAWHDEAHLDPGFDTGGRAFAQVHPDIGGYPDRDSVLHLLSRASLASEFASLLPVGEGFVLPFADTRGQTLFAQYGAMTPGAADAMGLRRREGRWFDDGDTAVSCPVAIVNAAFATAMGAGIGSLVRPRGTWASPTPLRVIGIVDDTRRPGADTRAVATVFVPLGQVPDATYTFMRSLAPLYAVWRDTPPASSTAPAFVQRWYAAAPSLAIGPVRPLSALNDDARDAPGRSAGLLGVLAAAALFLSMVGMYSTTSLAVTAHRRDLGIRVALGAPRTRLMRGALGPHVWLVMAGAAVGFASALLPAPAHVLAGPGMWLAVPLAGAMFVAAILVALAVPAWRIATTDPLRLLRGH